MYEARIQDDRVNAFRVVKGQTAADVEAKANAQLAIWEERWIRKQAALEKRLKMEKRRNSVESEAARAQELNSEAEAAVRALESILSDGCREPIVTWENLKDKSLFGIPHPSMPNPIRLPDKPKPSEFDTVLSLWEKLIPGRKTAKALESKKRFDEAIERWDLESQSLKRKIDGEYTRYQESVAEWRSQKEAFDEARKAQHAFIESLHHSYDQGEQSAVEYLVSEALNRSVLPESFPQGFELRYDSETKIVVIDYELPNQEALPKDKAVKYVASRKELQYIPVSETWRKAAYDSVLYQMALRTINRVFTVDRMSIIHSVVFNGWVRSIDRATGAEAHGCILSIQAGRDEFICLDLARVDPRVCFKSLKGVASSKLTELTPIRPILKLNREDARFVEAYAVAETLDERTNLAAMDWQDFENLIREIFEKEFSRNGAEVRITRASRDGGVDAVVFDPDPLRGGKIVIQAKRYTNTVGVSAVRDLFGTVQHEGAMKGILVTTATYGSDAYEFARDKPLTLISGAELLGMLERHGHRAKIDLAEARAERQGTIAT